MEIDQLIAFFSLMFRSGLIYIIIKENVGLHAKTAALVAPNWLVVPHCP